MFSRRALSKAGLVASALAMIAVPAISLADTITRQLSVGMRGADVTAMQTYFAQDATIYPQGLITGYFGFLTKSAVSNFQSKYGISPVGRVGPATLPVLNAKMAGGTVGEVTQGNWGIAPTISPVSVNTSRNNAIVNWNTNENAKGVVYYSTTPLVLGEHSTYVDVSGFTAMTDAGYRGNQSVAISGLTANTIYYYLVYTTDMDGNVSVTWPAIFQTTY